jgi:hypothetical protein
VDKLEFIWNTKVFFPNYYNAMPTFNVENLKK